MNDVATKKLNPFLKFQCRSLFLYQRAQPMFGLSRHFSKLCQIRQTFLEFWQGSCSSQVTTLNTRVLFGWTRVSTHDMAALIHVPRNHLGSAWLRWWVRSSVSLILRRQKCGVICDKPGQTLWQPKISWDFLIVAAGQRLQILCSTTQIVGIWQLWRPTSLQSTACFVCSFVS